MHKITENNCFPTLELYFQKLSEKEVISVCKYLSLWYTVRKPIF